MKNRFSRILSLICAVMLLISLFSVWAVAEETSATPTDLESAGEETLVTDPVEGPEQTNEQEPEQIPAVEEEQGPAEEPEGNPADEPGQEPVEEPEKEPAEEQKKEEQAEEEKEEAAKEPEGEPEENPENEPEEEPADGDGDSAEIIITKTLTLGQSWSGRMSKTKHAVLKLDLSGSARVYMLVEGKDVWATVEKADQQTENPSRTQTDPETGRMVISWSAQAGSYLITLGPVAPNRLAMATVTFMDAGTYEAWETAQITEEPEQKDEPEEADEQEPEQTEPEPEPAEEPETESGEEPEEEQDPDAEQDPEAEQEPGTEPEQETEPEETPETNGEEGELGEEAGNEPEEEPPEENRPESEIRPERHITVGVTWDVPDPDIGDTAHFKAQLDGYEGLQYTMQWQCGPDKQTWNDIPGETNDTMDVVVTEENNLLYWRILVYVEEDQI